MTRRVIPRVTFDDLGGLTGAHLQNEPDVLTSAAKGETIMNIDGLYNFRGTGGLPLTTGGTTRDGVLYRSAALGALTPNGLEELAATDIGVVVDFRTQTERDAAPDRVPSSRPIQVVNLSLLQGAMSDMARDLAPTGAAPSQEQIAQALSMLPTLGDLYTSMLTDGAPQFTEVARFIATGTDAAPSGVLVHCTAGKDRTGVATALMLEAAGVEREAVVADYASSAANLAGPWADGMLKQITDAGIPLTPTLQTLVTGTPPEAIEQALGWVDENHGGAAEYLRSGGLTDPELQSLRARFAG